MALEKELAMGKLIISLLTVCVCGCSSSRDRPNSSVPRGFRAVPVTAYKPLTNPIAPPSPPKSARVPSMVAPTLTAPSTTPAEPFVESEEGDCVDGTCKLPGK